MPQGLDYTELKKEEMQTSGQGYLRRARELVRQDMAKLKGAELENYQRNEVLHLNKYLKALKNEELNSTIETLIDQDIKDLQLAIEEAASPSSKVEAQRALRAYEENKLQRYLELFRFLSNEDDLGLERNREGVHQWTEFDEEERAEIVKEGKVRREKDLEEKQKASRKKNAVLDELKKGFAKGTSSESKDEKATVVSEIAVEKMEIPEKAHQIFNEMQTLLLEWKERLQLTLKILEIREKEPMLKKLFQKDHDQEMIFDALKLALMNAESGILALEKSVQGHDIASFLGGFQKHQDSLIYAIRALEPAMSCYMTIKDPQIGKAFNTALDGKRAHESDRALLKEKGLTDFNSLLILPTQISPRFELFAKELNGVLDGHPLQEGAQTFLDTTKKEVAALNKQIKVFDPKTKMPKWWKRLLNAAKEKFSGKKRKTTGFGTESKLQAVRSAPNKRKETSKEMGLDLEHQEGGVRLEGVGGTAK